MTQMRTHTCGQLRLADAGKKVTLSGWLENLRVVGSGLGFAVIRDFYGTTQAVIENEELLKTFRSINKESTVQLTGTVRERDSKNPKQADRKSCQAEFSLGDDSAQVPQAVH